MDLLNSVEVEKRAKAKEQRQRFMEVYAAKSGKLFDPYLRAARWFFRETTGPGSESIEYNRPFKYTHVPEMGEIRGVIEAQQRKGDR